VEKRDVLS